MPDMSPPGLSDWSAHLRAIALRALGHPSRPVARATQRAITEAVSGEPDGSLADAASSPEGLLWHAVLDDRVPIDHLIDSHANSPLFPQESRRTIEVWTEAELCSLHALWALSHRRERADWLARSHAARDWHLEHTQPDNATNRPWALHVFLLSGSPEGQMYAETLLHNTLATAGEPEPFSAMILLDSAHWIEQRE